MPSYFAKRNLFPKRWMDKKLSMEMGKLVPFFHQEIYPGDFLKLRTHTSVKLADFGQPVFDSLSLKFWYFYVPYRTINDDFEQFITGWSLKEEKPSTVLWPFLTSKANTNSDWGIGSLMDYLEFPVTQNAVGVQVSAMPARAYQKICNDWFVSEFLQSRIVISTESGEDETTSLKLQSRCWPRDYFTQALPFTQLGSPIMIPLSGGFAPVVQDSSNPAIKVTGAQHSNGSYNLAAGQNAGNSQYAVINSGLNLTIDESLVFKNSGLVADLSKVPAFSVNTGRLSFQMQRIQERLARGGVRLTEYIRSVFAVFPPDARLSRAEYLGGGTCPVLISEVVQNSGTTASSTQGNRTAIGDAYNSLPTITKGFTEHGIIMGLMSCLPVPTYFQGLRRDMFGSRTRFDFLQPELAHIGEQPLYNAELYLQGNEKDMEEFGYIPQYQWFREFKSTVCGDFRDNMRNFFFGREFSTLPVLNEDFVVANPSTAPFAAGAKNATRPIWVDVLVFADLVRCLPKKGTPGLMDH
ncbi:major capsid protein [Sigmofec virus UA08Rod_7256]|uniref:Major capsid protein n=1 Tax=Sigmofec virus UA08Rod_7256 TaxID=2929244 RepID=A0A976N174_9VIRU|nr:major capsid protein [Sigmofec virus UA08Rod_7256]